MAAQQAHDTQIRPAHGAVTLNGLAGITGTGRQITAVTTKEGADAVGIQPDQVNQNLFHLLIAFQCLFKEFNSLFLSAATVRFCETTTISRPSSCARFLRKLSLMLRLTLFRATAALTFLFDTARPSLA
jgi:hypothetical protein